MFLSIIIPVYNGSKYLEETIKSVLQQPCDDYELILLDDGSQDDSLSICRRYSKIAPPRCQVIVESHANMGVSKTRNKGIEIAHGDVIIFMDQDDAMRSNFYTVELKQNLQQLQNQGVEMIVCGAWWCDNNLEKGTFRSIEVQRHGLFDGRKDSTSWGGYTFNMNIYFRSLFFDGVGNPTPVRFFDLPLDVETTFRHMSQYGAKRLLFSDKYSFCLRRCNEESVSSNWDWLKVYQVRCDAYYRLISWHKYFYGEDAEGIAGAEKAYLRSVDLWMEGYVKEGAKSSLISNDLIKSPRYVPFCEIYTKYSKSKFSIDSYLGKIQNTKKSHDHALRKLHNRCREIYYHLWKNNGKSVRIKPVLIDI